MISRAYSLPDVAIDRFMKIQVTCPSCLTRFEVDEKFAGKKGPCPKCKAVIQVPEKNDAVVIHSPEGDGPKDSQGRLVLKPISRQETKVTRKGIFIVAGAVLVALAIALALRFTGESPLALQILGLVLLAPPLVYAGYSFARDQELEPYRGREMWLRAAIVSGVLVATWLIYAFIPAYLFEFELASNAEYWQFGVTILIMLGIGTFAAVAAFELETGNGFVVAALYYVVVLILAVIANVPLAGIEP